MSNAAAVPADLPLKIHRKTAFSEGKSCISPLETTCARFRALYFHARRTRGFRVKPAPFLTRRESMATRKGGARKGAAKRGGAAKKGGRKSSSRAGGRKSSGGSDRKSVV